MDTKKVVFISGSNRGIGKATITFFAKQGWNIIAHARKESDGFNKFVDNLSSEYHVVVTPIFFDLCDEVAMKEQITSIIYNQKMSIDALVNNAGVCEIKLFLLTSLTSVRKTFDVNFFAPLRLTQLLLKRMPTGSSIVNVSSIDGLEPKRGETAYATSKAALLAWTEVLKQELLGRVRVNAVAPHATDTDMAHSIENQAVWKGKPIINPDNIARAIYYLAADAHDVTGNVLKITGQLD